jgi:hypothetical protein
MARDPYDHHPRAGKLYDSMLRDQDLDCESLSGAHQREAPTALTEPLAAGNIRKLR